MWSATRGIRPRRRSFVIAGSRATSEYCPQFLGNPQLSTFVGRSLDKRLGRLHDARVTITDLTLESPQSAAAPVIVTDSGSRAFHLTSRFALTRSQQSRERFPLAHLGPGRGTWVPGPFSIASFFLCRLPGSRSAGGLDLSPLTAPRVQPRAWGFRFHMKRDLAAIRVARGDQRRAERGAGALTS